MANPLNQITNMFSGLFQSKDKSIIGVDVGASAIKVVQMRESGGRAVLETYGSISLGPYDETKNPIGSIASLPAESLAKALADLSKEANVTTKRAAFAVPSAATLVFTLNIPASVKKSDFKTVIPIEARRYIPVDISEVSLDWWVLPNQSFQTPGSSNSKKANEGHTVLVVAVRNDTISAFKDVVSQAGLSQDFFEVEAFSSVRSCIVHDLSTIVLADIGAARTKLVFVDGGVIRDVHVINRGSEDITQALTTSFNMSFEEAEALKKQSGLNAGDEAQRANMMQSIDFIVSEMKNVVYQYEQKYSSTVDKVVLSGGGSQISGLEPYLNEKLTFDIEFANPFSQTGAPEFLRETLKDAGPEFAVANGLCLRALKQ